VAQALAWAGDIAAARTTAEEIGDDVRRAEALVTAARALTQAGKNEAARTVLAAARTAAERLEDDAGSAQALAAVALALVQAGDNESAREMLASAHAAA
jgi:hypothetical protein